MLNSLTNKVKTFIFQSGSQGKETVGGERKRKRTIDSEDEDRDVQVISVKKPKLQTSESLFGGWFSTSAVQSMSDWVQKKTPSLFNWSSDRKTQSAVYQRNGNGINGRPERSQTAREDGAHYRSTAVDASRAYTQGSCPANDRQPNRQGNGTMSLARPSIHTVVRESRTVQTDSHPGRPPQRSNVSDMFRPRNRHKFSAVDSVRLDDKMRYQQLLQKFTTVPLEPQETARKGDSIKCPVRVPQLPRFYFSSNKSILGSTINETEEKVPHMKPERPKLKVRPSQSTPRQPQTAVNGVAPDGDTSLLLTDISVIPTVPVQKRLEETIDLTEDTEEEKKDKSFNRFRRPQSPSNDYRDSKFLSENWIKDMMSTYSSAERERHRQLAEAEIKARLYDDKRKQDEADLERKIRQQMWIHQKAPVEIEEPPVVEVEDEEEEEEEEEALPELTDEMENVITNALSPGIPSQVLVDKFRLQITRGDIATLAGLNWLNDEVINFYMNLLMERGEKDNRPKVYAFNTFFYPKVVSGGQSAVKRWTRRVDVLAVDYILVPVHLGMHWCLAVINFKKKDIQYYDSMGGNNLQCLNALKKYLCDESKDKKNTDFDLTGWKTTVVKDIPQQMNGSDCGMFACKFAEYITREASITFTQADMPYFRRRMVYEIVTAKLLQ